MRPLTGDSGEKRDIFHYNAYTTFAYMYARVYALMLWSSTSLDVRMCRFLYAHILIHSCICNFTFSRSCYIFCYPTP